MAQHACSEVTLAVDTKKYGIRIHKALFRQLGERRRQHADGDHDQGHDRLDSNGRADCQKETADLKINFAQRRDVILLDGVHVILHKGQAGAVVLFAFFHIAERFYFPHSVGAEVTADTLHNDIARIIQQESEKSLNTEVKQIGRASCRERV